MHRIYFLLGILLFFSCAEDEEDWQRELDHLLEKRRKILASASDYPCTDPSEWGIYKWHNCLLIPYYKPAVDLDEFQRRLYEINNAIAWHYSRGNVQPVATGCSYISLDNASVSCYNGRAGIYEN